VVPLIRLVPLTLALLGQTDPKEQARQFLDSCQAGKFTEASANFDATPRCQTSPRCQTLFLVLTY